MKIFLISNMYPSNEQPGYGIFVKIIKENLSRYAQIDTQAVIKGRGKNIFHKIFKYLKFYIDIIIKGLFHKYDVIYTHYGTHSAIPLLFLKFFVKKPLIINVHGFDLFVGSSKEVAESKSTHGFLYPFFKKLAKDASLIVVPSHFYKSIIKKEFNIEDNKIFVSASGGVDLNIFKELNKNVCRIEMNIPENMFILGFVSRLVEAKGWKTFLEAINILNKSDLNFKAIIVGSGDDKEKFFATALELNLQEKIIHYDFVDRYQLSKLYNVFDIFIFPTHSESLGLVALESLACGTPVICSDIEPLNQYIDEGVDGFLFELNNSINLKNKIFEYLQLTKKEKEVIKINSLKKSINYSSEKVSYDLYDKFNHVV